MEVYVGARNVTSQFNAFFGRDNVTLDGNFAGSVENQAYAQALTSVRNALRDAVPAAGIDGQSRQEARAAITERFDAYTALVQSEGCEGRFESIPVLQGLYEELTQFIESSAFERVPEAMQQKIVALQAETFSRLEQRGTHRGVAAEGRPTGTATELAQFNPVAEPFRAHQLVIERVTPTAGTIAFDNQCSINQGDVTVAESAPIYGSEGSQPQPFAAAAVVNMDFRYSLHQRPAVTPAPQPSAGRDSSDGGLGRGGRDPLDDL